MVNFSLNAGSLMGIVLALAGAGLYFLRSFRPNLARDYDVFFAAIALLCGGILFFQSWRLDPILQFGVFLLSGSTVFFAVDSIRLRDIATEQAKRNTPLVDDDRPVSRSYQYQSEDYGPGYGSFADQRSSPARRIRGSRDPRDFRDGGYDEGNGWDEYDDRRGNRRPPRSLDRSRDRDDRGEGGRVRTRRAALERSDSGYDDAWGDAGYGNAGYDNAGYETGGYGNPRYENSGYGGPGYESPGYETPGPSYGTAGANREYENREPNNSREYGDRYGNAETYGDRGYGSEGYGASAYGDTGNGGTGANGSYGVSPSDPAQSYGTPLDFGSSAEAGAGAVAGYGEEFAGGIDPTEDPSVYGNGGGDSEGRYDSSYSSSYSSGSYGGTAYGTEAGAAPEGFNPDDVGSAYGEDSDRSGNPNRRPRRRPPSTLLSRSPYGDDAF